MYLCIDVGGTKTLIGLFNERGRLLKAFKFMTPHSESEFFATLAQQTHILIDLKQVKRICIALPGPIQNGQPLYFGNLPWSPMNFTARLRDCFLGIPILVVNDAYASAYAEARDRRGTSIFFTFSTGIGAAVITDGKPSEKFANFEPGHNVYNWYDKRLEWEDIASARAVSTHYKKPVNELSGIKEWTDVAHRMSTGLIPCILAVKPDRLIFGGPLGYELPRYRRTLQRILRRDLMRGTPMPRLLETQYDSESVIYGCYFLVTKKSR